MSATYVHHVLGMVSRGKLRRVTIAVSIAILVLTVLSILNSQENTNDYDQRQVSSSELTVPEGVGGGRNVFFLKVHKCASSTVQNILMRYGEKRRLNFVLPYKDNYLGHPELLDVSTQAIPLSSSAPPDSPSSPSTSATYNILCHHCRFSETGVREAMPSNTLRLAIVRDPVDLFESLYSYTDLAAVYEMDLEEFVAMPDDWISKLGRFQEKIGYNQMAFDFGMSESDFTDVRKVAEFIGLLDASFDLVMVAEHFDESMVLMKNLLGLDVQDVVYFTKNKRFTEEKRNLTELVRRQIREVNWVDQMIYDHFLDVFRRRVSSFGEKLMRSEVDDLRRWNRHWFRNCGVRSSHDDESLPIAFRQSTNKVEALTLDDRLIGSNREYVDFCETLAIAELPFTSRLRNEHINRHGSLWLKFLRAIGLYVS